MTKAAWKKNPNTARPQRTTPAKQPGKEGAALTADGKRRHPSKIKKTRAGKNTPTARRKTKDGKSLTPRRIPNNAGAPLPPGRAEKVLR